MTSPRSEHGDHAPRPLTEAVLHRAYGTSRISRARRVIANALAHCAGAFTVEELYERASAGEVTVGLATVYRAVAAMLDSGFLATVGTRDGVALYSRCSGGAHHHHLVCTACSTVVAIDCPLEVSLNEASAPSGCTITGHEIVLYGLCGQCALVIPAPRADG